MSISGITLAGYRAKVYRWLKHKQGQGRETDSLRDARPRPCVGSCAATLTSRPKEVAWLVTLLTRTIDGDRYPFAERILLRKQILDT